MSLTIKIKKVYNLNKNVLKDTLLDVDRSIDCLCKIKFKNCTQIRNLTKHRSALKIFIQNDLDSREKDKLLSNTDDLVIYRLGSELEYNDFLEIECYLPGKFSKKFFFFQIF